MVLRLAKFSHHGRVEAAPTSDKVTPTAVVEVFTIWITGIIPLLFDNMLPETGLTSTVMCAIGVCLHSTVCVCVCLYPIVHTQIMVLPFFSVFELLPKLRHGDVIFACDLINRQNYRSLPKGQYCCVVMEMRCRMSNAFSQSNPH